MSESLPFVRKFRGYVKLTKQQEDRFWNSVEKTESCWLWKKAFYLTGYGKFHLNYGAFGSHRISWFLKFGAVSDDLFVLHKCDVPACCNPEHLFLGTQMDNMRDKIAKGRHAKGSQCVAKNPRRGDNHPARTNPERLSRGDSHYTRVHPELAPRGEKNPAAKMTEREVMYIRDRYSRGSVTQSELAREYDITQAAIWAIVKRVNWRHI